MKKETKINIVVCIIVLIYLIMIFGFWNSEKYQEIHKIGLIGLACSVVMVFGFWIYYWIEGSDE